MKHKFKNNPFASGPKNMVFAVIVFVLCLALLTKLTDYTRQSQNISYSQFLNLVESDRVKSIHISGQDLFGVLKDGSRFESTVVENPKDLDLLRQHNVEFSVSTPTGQLNFWHFLMIFSFIILPLAIWYFLRQTRGSSNSSGGGIFNMGKNKAKLFMPSTIKVNFSSVAGANDAKQELKDIVDFLKNPEKYRRLGAKIPRGVLLVGEPGNGKTLLAKAVAGEANCPFFSITGSDFIEVFVGVGAARVRDLFAQARKHAPSIIFIDEIDAIGRQRGSGFGGGHDEREQTLNQLLTEMDGFDSSNASVIILAATNMPDVLDKALLRPGRFDRRIDVPFPDTDSREQILKIHAKAIKLDQAVDLKKIAQETAGFSGADLANLINKAAINASKNNQEMVTEKDIIDAHKMLLQSQNSVGATSNPLTKGNSTAKVFMPSQIKVSFKDVAGVVEAKEELQEVIDFLKNPEKYRRLGAKIPRGVLLVGEPGNGKTLLAKAVAGEANCPFFNVSGSEFVEMYVGVGASRVRDLFTQARKHKPSIIFIDEIDAVGSHRIGGHAGNEERNQTLNQLLIEMDGFESEFSSIIIIGATNRMDKLDKALMRRFTRQVEVPYPDLQSRHAILKVHSQALKFDDSVDLSKLARGTPGFSGASLANLLNEAALLAAKRDDNSLISQHDIDLSRDKVLLGKESKTKMLTPEDKKVTAYHEAGHALMHLLQPMHSDPLFKITILPRGMTLGTTHSLPEREKYNTTKEEALAHIRVCLGGRVAEMMVFNMMSTGAGSDFDAANKMARNMVCYWGMSSELGCLIFNPHDGSQKYSEKTMELIDTEIKKILDTCYQETLELLTQNRDKLEILSQTLLEKETLYAQEVYDLLGIESRETFKIV